MPEATGYPQFVKQFKILIPILVFSLLFFYLTEIKIIKITAQNRKTHQQAKMSQSNNQMDILTGNILDTDSLYFIGKWIDGYTKLSNVDIAVVALVYSKHYTQTGESFEGKSVRNKDTVFPMKYKTINSVLNLIANLLYLLSQRRSTYTINISVCGVDFDTQSSTKDLLQKYLDVFDVLDVASLPINKSHIQNTHEIDKLIFQSCVEKTLWKTSPRYVLTLDTETVLNKDFVKVLFQNVHNHLDRNYARGQLISEHVKEDTAFINYQDTANYRGRKLTEINCQFVSLIFVFASLFTCVTNHMYLKSQSKHALKLLWAIFLAYFSAIFLALEPQIEWRRLFSPHLYTVLPCHKSCMVTSNSSNGQAVIYTTSFARRLLFYLSKTTCTETVYNYVETFANACDLQYFTVEPSTLQNHVALK